jgi:signal transduction histidine kinase
VQQAVDQHQAYECEYRLFTKTGQLRWVWERGRGIYDANGRLAFLEGFVTNVTDSKHAQEERETLLKELTARHVEMESFVYTVSHDLKSPLITIGGFAQLLEKDLAVGDSARAAEDLAEIQKAQAHMQTLIADLLALSKSGRPTGTMEPVDLRQLVQDALAHCQGALNGAHARVTQADRWPTVRADRGRLFQALQNLIDNAAKFRRADADLSIDLGWTVADGELRLHVRDNGRGVAPEYHERIFGLFERLEPGVDGTGVGLAIAKRVVEAHGGRLWVESTPNTGSCFFIGLPVSAMVSSGSTTTLQN